LPGAAGVGRKLPTVSGTGSDPTIFTMTERLKKKEFREDAIRLIEKRFTNAKRVKVGIQKPGQHGVHAVKVFDFIPNVKLLINKTATVVCDDVIEQELALTKEKVETNDFLLHQFKDSQAEESKLQIDLHRSGLYKCVNSEAIPNDVLKNL
jgi:hypothetical protein